MKYLHLFGSKLRRTVPALPVVALLALASCTDPTAPLSEPTTFPPIDGQQALYSLDATAFASEASAAADDAVSGSRWCNPGSVWFDPTSALCNGHGGQPPFGSVSEADGDLLVSGGVSKGAAFVWTGPPSRVDPFPSAGDFTLEVRMKVEGLAVYGTGLHVREWNPAETEGSNNPNYGKVLVVWADGAGGLRVQLLGGTTVGVPGSTMGWHMYRLEYEAGVYTLYVDDQPVLGPVASDRRPTAFWLGNPNFQTESRDWTDWRISQLTVTAPAPEAPEVVQVSVDVKPEACPSPVNVRAKGVLPVAIAGSADLDVSQIDPATLRLEGVAHEGSSVEDVTAGVGPLVGKTLEDCSADGADGHADLVVKFSNEAIVAALGEAVDGESRTLRLTGTMLPAFGGGQIEGEDVVVMQVPLEVSVDVEPTACPSPVNVRAGGSVPVAVAGADDLDVSQIDVSSLRLEGLAPEGHAIEDVSRPVHPMMDKSADDCSAEGADGTDDLVLDFSNAALAEVIGDAAHGDARTLSLTGKLLPEFGGTEILGEDLVLAIVPVEVSLEINPGTCPAPMNRRAQGVLPVAIAGSEDFDVGLIDVASLRLEGVAPLDRGFGFEDVASPVAPYIGRTGEDCAGTGPDGTPDLVVKFPSRLVAEALAGAESGEVRPLSLTGYLVIETAAGRTPLVGEDLVKIVGGGNGGGNR